jgi:hypothetical protein
MYSSNGGSYSRKKWKYSKKKNQTFWDAGIGGNIMFVIIYLAVISIFGYVLSPELTPDVLSNTATSTRRSRRSQQRRARRRKEQELRKEQERLAWSKSRDKTPFEIVVDSGASRTVSPIESHFRDLYSYEGEARGFDGSTAKIEGKGTFVFDIEDDYGQVHTIEIPDSLYIPKATGVLLSPQRWAGLKSTITETGMDLYWGKGRYKYKYKRTVHFASVLYGGSPCFYSAPAMRSRRCSKDQCVRSDDDDIFMD